MSTSSTQKQKLAKGLGVALGECLFGLNGAFFFQRFGLNVPEAAAAGCLIGAAAGYGITEAILRTRNKKHPISYVPEITKPEVPAGLHELRTGGVSGTVSANSTQARIEAAISRLPDPSAANIRVEVRDHTVVLKGVVNSWAEEAEAERIAFDMPGIDEVDNQLVVPKGYRAPVCWGDSDTPGKKVFFSEPR
jgi:hypothetical protein